MHLRNNHFPDKKNIAVVEGGCYTARMNKYPLLVHAME